MYFYNSSFTEVNWLHTFGHCGQLSLLSYWNHIFLQKLYFGRKRPKRKCKKRQGWSAILDNILFNCKENTKKYEHGSPGLVVMGGDSCSKGCEFESLHRILVGHFSICCKNCNVCEKTQKMKNRLGCPLF